MKLGIVASVGGLKPVAVVGLAQAAAERGLWGNVRGFAAASGGAPWCTLLASGMNPAQVANIACRVKRSDYWQPNHVGYFSRMLLMWGLRRQLGATIAEVGVDNGKAMEEWLEQNLPVKTFEELAVPLALAATNLNRRRVEMLRSGPLIPAIRASTAIPMVYKPATMMIEGQECKLLDGGVARPLPVSSLVEQVEAEVILAVVACNTGRDEYVRSRSIDLGTYLDLMLDTLVYDHIQAIIELAVQKAALVLLPVRVMASMAKPEETVAPAIEAALGQARELFGSNLWDSIEANPAAHAGKVYVVE